MLVISSFSTKSDARARAKPASVCVQASLRELEKVVGEEPDEFKVGKDIFSYRSIVAPILREEKFMGTV